MDGQRKADVRGVDVPGADVQGAVIDIDSGLACWRRLECSDASELVFLFQEWEPAVRVGIHAYLAYPDCEFDAIEPAIDAAYQRIRGRSPIPWARAAPAARRVWQKLRRQDAAIEWPDDSARAPPQRWNRPTPLVNA